MKTDFDKNIFLDVVKSNIESISHSILHDAETKAIKIGKPLMTEDETRDFARHFFTSCVAKFLADRICI